MLGPFYELETSSQALALFPGEHFLHIHRTIHLEGAHSALDHIARHAFNVGLDDIQNGLKEKLDKLDTD